MYDSSEYSDLPGQVRPASIWLSLRLQPSRLDLRVMYNDMGVTRSSLLWETGISRPPGKSGAECIEAAMYRVARASADGLLVPPGWDSIA